MFCKRSVIILIILCLTAHVAAAARADGALHTREQVREMYISHRPGNLSSLYTRPASDGYEDIGSASESAIAQAVSALNFCRWLTYLTDNVTAIPEYNLPAQCGALLLSRSESMNHIPTRPYDMPAAFYKTALSATQSSVLFGSSYTTGTLPADAITLFMRDAGDDNLPFLGHRRWLLKANLLYTGVGMADYGEQGACLVMPVQDESGADMEAEYVAWPAVGAFPADLIYPEDAWSFTPNPALYDLRVSQPRVTLTRLDTGESWSFNSPGTTDEGSFYAIELSDLGDGPCLIFRPGGVAGYEQNQRWQVCVEDVAKCTGGTAEFVYEVEIISLEPIAALNIELSEETLSLTPGESHILTASVVPSWADDVSVKWYCADDSVATVDPDGLVTAVGTGDTLVYVSESSGISAVCRVVVK